MSDGDEDELSLLIGQITRASVLLEEHLRHVWLACTMPSLAIHLLPDQFGKIYDDCLTMVEHLEAPDDRRTIVREALHAVKRAMEGRNRTVHDIVSTDEPGAWVAIRRPRRGLFGGSVRRFTDDDLRSVLRELQRARHRVQALSYVIFQYTDAENMSSSYADSNGWDIVAGKFELSADGQSIPALDFGEVQADTGSSGA